MFDCSGAQCDDHLCVSLQCAHKLHDPFLLSTAAPIPTSIIFGRFLCAPTNASTSSTHYAIMVWRSAKAVEIAWIRPYAEAKCTKCGQLSNIRLWPCGVCVQYCGMVSDSSPLKLCTIAIAVHAVDVPTTASTGDLPEYQQLNNHTSSVGFGGPPTTHYRRITEWSKMCK